MRQDGIGALPAPGAHVGADDLSGGLVPLHDIADNGVVGKS